MGNGSIKAPRLEETCLASGIKESPVWESSEQLKLRIAWLEEELARRDHELRAKELQLQALQRELDAKVSQIDKLQDAMGYNNLGRSPPARHSHRLLSFINQGSTRFHRVAVEVHRRLKAKEGVSAEPTSGKFYSGHKAHHVSTERTRIRKDSGTKRLINEAIMNNDFLKKLEPQHTREMVDCMYEKIFTANQVVIQEGEPGNYLYVLAGGLLEVMQHGKLLGQMRPGTAFGELAILYNCKRTATVKAVTQSHIWALDRQMSEHYDEIHSGQTCRVLQLPAQEYFDKGEYIIREGEEGNTFFIIANGEVLVTQSTEGYPEPQEIKTLGVGDYFGEKALISEDVRSANIIAKENDTQCLVVDRDHFNQMVGTYEELQAYLREYVEQLSISDEKRNAITQSPFRERGTEAEELRNLREKTTQLSSSSFLHELQIVATLGMGGFGRVELVKLKDEDTAFALKCIKKQHIIDTKQQDHIYSEKNILQMSNCNFIVRGFFEEATARFCIGCVLEAFDYLHGKGVVYRDLKPENLLLDTEGYIKMTDFGFAKRIGLGKKTWTFCGTPEYVAPEVIMNKGHDFGADCWSLGILIFELLTGSPPFAGSDPIKIYTMVLHGIEKVDFPKKISKRPEDLIRRLCRINPAERLGNKKNGIMDIKKHKWFQGFNWEGLRRRKLTSPLKRELKGPLDHSYFDIFPPELEEPPDELSGWDKDF
ncbi:cGMP-dependent protein kinase 2 [Bagarius yarrelli]|uniref:cGMP-dependent protein kinase n=1 Tax=Bagarius yarrelli TaxID=175774 RepID=A0A556TN62_BAGYA|nr:cGMP-dependent protein kinase 2 [Bagarius yarrelli]